MSEFPPYPPTKYVTGSGSGSFSKEGGTGEAMSEFTPEDWEAIVSRQKARIAELEEALRKVRPLLQDTVDVHSDPSDAGYNECDTAPCSWCEIAKEVLKKP